MAIIASVFSYLGKRYGGGGEPPVNLAPLTPLRLCIKEERESRYFLEDAALKERIIRPPCFEARRCPGYWIAEEERKRRSIEREARLDRQDGPRIPTQLGPKARDFQRKVPPINTTGLGVTGSWEEREVQPKGPSSLRDRIKWAIAPVLAILSRGPGQTA